MRQALHILRKDVRHLWPRVVVMWLLLAAYAVFDVRSVPVNIAETGRANSIAGLLNLSVPLCIAFLIGLVVLEEALADDRQFWRTRPYHWPQLLLAKIVFLILALNVPLFVSDCYILAVQKFAVMSILPSIFLRQCYMTILFILPSFVIASVAKNIAQFVLTWLVLLFAVISEMMIMSAGKTSVEINELFVTPFLLIAGCAIVVWQYAFRRTFVARTILFGSVLALPIALWALPRLLYRNRVVFVEPPRHADLSGVRIAYALESPAPSQSWQTPPGGLVAVQIPLIVEGLPEKTLLRGSGRMIVYADGNRFPPGRGEVMGFVGRTNGQYRLRMDWPVAEIDEIGRLQVELHGSFRLEIVTDEVKGREPLVPHSFFATRGAICSIFQTNSQVHLTCRSGLERFAETSIQAGSQGQMDLTLVPSSIPWGLSPTSTLMTSTFADLPATDLVMIPRQRIRQFERRIDQRDVQFSEFVLQRRTD